MIIKELLSIEQLKVLEQLRKGEGEILLNGEVVEESPESTTPSDKSFE